MVSDRSEAQSKYAPISPRILVIITAAFCLAAAGLTFWTIWTTKIPGLTHGPLTPAEQASQDIGRTQLRVDIIRNALGLVAGFGGLAALLLAIRKQYQKEQVDFEHTRHQDRDHEHQLRVAEDARYDAAERRITELQIKAADQLGNEKAAVRLAGMYALERLAHDNPQHRQLVVDIICAYLRMPHPALPMFAASLSAEPDSETARSGFGDAEEEDVVRTSAQQILIRRSFPSAHGPESDDITNSQYWPDISVNLSGAVLHNFKGRMCMWNSADFSSAYFFGDTSFFRSQFNGTAVFTGATFAGKAQFTAARFLHSPLLNGMRYQAGSADFGGARIFDWRSGERVGVPQGWKLIEDPEGNMNLMFVRLNHPAPSVQIVPSD